MNGPSLQQAGKARQCYGFPEKNVANRQGAEYT